MKYTFVHLILGHILHWHYNICDIEFLKLGLTVKKVGMKTRWSEGDRIDCVCQLREEALLICNIKIIPLQTIIQKSRSSHIDGSMESSSLFFHIHLPFLYFGRYNCKLTVVWIEMCMIESGWLFEYCQIFFSECGNRNK